MLVERFINLPIDTPYERPGIRSIAPLVVMKREIADLEEWIGNELDRVAARLPVPGLRNHDLLSDCLRTGDLAACQLAIIDEPDIVPCRRGRISAILNVRGEGNDLIGCRPTLNTRRLRRCQWLPGLVVNKNRDAFQ